MPEPLYCGSFNDPIRETSKGTPIVGAADFHIHQFANVGFGGRLLWGESFSDGGIAGALSSCGVEGLCVDGKEAAVCREVICRLASRPDDCRAACARTACPTSPPHGHLGAFDPVGAVLGQGKGHMVRGYPDFVGWPHWNTYTHQQAYHRWLRRAFDGGLKLIVMLAVNNEVLCKTWEHDHACDDATNVARQLQAARDLERFIDIENDCEQDGDGWYRIAESPEEARRIIEAGAMAVVLGVEVDALLECYRQGSCTENNIGARIAEYASLGVRHVFPVHLFDNAIGGAAVYDDFFNFGNLIVNQQLFGVRECSDEYAFRFGETSSTVDDVLNTMARKFGLHYDGYPKNDAHCNKRGLEPLGRIVVGALMDASMIIDLDHMSANTRDGVLDIAEACDYPGLVSGHAGFTELYNGHRKSEGQLTPTEVDRLLRLGGLLAPKLTQGNRAEVDAHRRGNRTVIPHDCGDSAKSFAQAYLYAVDAEKRHAKDNKRLPAVGFGSDLNGLAGMPAPRFGPYACGGDLGEEQTVRVLYPVPLFSGLGEAMPPSQTGHRVFDINVDGFAHVGMFPDFVAELRAIGVSNEDLGPMFRSAEAYIALWERVEQKQRPSCRVAAEGSVL